MSIYITADIHGYYSIWQKIIRLVKPQDTLIIAGDLFGTRYPEYANYDFRPADIRAEINDVKNFYYVYGNCDIPDFTTGYTHELRFDLQGKHWLLTHGDRPYDAAGADIVVTGHTHKSEIYTENGILYLNPGSPSKPRNGRQTIIIYNEKPLITKL